MNKDIISGARNLDQVKELFIGKPGSPVREQYEFDLTMDILGEMIRKIRKERGLTQSQLGARIGVQKAQISRLERKVNNISVNTLLKIFAALQTEIKIKAEVRDKAPLDNQ